MSERVATVVDGFMLLDPEEQIAAYLEIEAAWKALQAEAEPAPDPPPDTPRTAGWDAGAF
jgi:hypothetical protein